MWPEGHRWTVRLKGFYGRGTYVTLVTDDGGHWTSRAFAGDSTTGNASSQSAVRFVALRTDLHRSIAPALLLAGR
jgi:hypothetical protein